MTSRGMSFQDNKAKIYDSDSDMQQDDDIDQPIGKKINSKGNYMRNDNEKKQKNEYSGEQKSNNDVLKKNRQSARQCRERKKIYIQLLETKVNELRQQIQISKTNLKTQLKAITKLVADMDPGKIQYLQSKIEIQKQISLINPSEKIKQMKKIIDLYLYKYDVNGKLRKQLVDSQFQSLLKHILDHKMLNYWDGSLGVTDLFEGNCFDIFALDSVNMVVNPFSANIHNNRSTMLHLLMQIRDVKHNLQAQGQRIKYLVQKLVKHLSPEGIQKFMLHPLYISQSNRLDVGVSFGDSCTSLSVKKAKQQ